MKLASSMDVPGAARHFQVVKYAPIPCDGPNLPSRRSVASALSVLSQLNMLDAAGNN